MFETWLPFTAKLTVFFPNDGKLHILNAASPMSARKTRVFVPICRNFDRDAPLQDTLDFNHQVFDEDKAIVEQQWPEDLPINLQDEVHPHSRRTKVPSPIVNVWSNSDLAAVLRRDQSRNSFCNRFHELAEARKPAFSIC
ncbi:MAG: hypothetical protein WDM76_02640 [Limisphaerales bacterium]